MDTPMRTSIHSYLGKPKSESSSIRSASEHNDVIATDPADLEKLPTRHEPAEADTTAQRTIRGWRWFFVCLVVFTTAFLYGLDTTIAANIQGPAVEAFGQVDKLAWIGTGFPLGSIAIILSLGKAYGIFNVRWLYLASIIMFEAGSALCGAAPNMSALIVGRIWAGMGGAGMYLGGLNIVSVFTSMRERPIYMGLVAIFWGVGCILGPVIGGAFADSAATWRWAFYINLVIFAVTSPLMAFFMPSLDPQPDKSLSEKLRHMDWIGSILNAVIYTTFLIALTFGGASWEWSSPGTIIAFVICGLSIIAFAIQQRFMILTSKEWRIFPVDFLGDPQLVLLYIVTSTAACGMFVALYYIPLYFQFAHGDNGVTTAIRLLPFIITFIVFVLANGLAMPIMGYYMPWYLFSNIFMVIGGALMYTLVDAESSKSLVYGFSVLIGVGAGSACQAAYSVVPAKIPVARIADGIGFVNAAQIGSIVISLAISGSVFQNIGVRHIAEALEGLDYSAAEIHAALAGVKSTVFSTTSLEIRMMVIEGIVKAISDSYILVVTAGAVGVVASIFMKREKLFMEMAIGG